SNLIALYPQSKIYRSVINMKRYRFGEGEYKYFAYPLPDVLQNVRENIYPHLAPLANEWMHRLSIDTSFPLEHAALIEHCHQHGQTRPTSLILKYETGGYNTLHQDLYGEVYFPFQVVFLLSEPKNDFEGGEFVMVEQLPRAQSKAQVLNLQQGDALIFTTNFRPVLGTRGYYRAKIRHGVSPLLSGTRYALGVIFHDAV
ncbi:MAG: 2OG-Fe(II) oxygenase, partial [Flammeovirgaceae bacterium]